MASKRSIAVEAQQLARRFPEEVATEGNLDLIDTLCAEDIVDHSPLGDVRGRQALKDQLGSLLAAFEDFSATVEDIVAEDDTAAMRVTLRGTHRGEFMGIEPTGQSFEIENHVFTRIEDGQIVERWVMPDTLGMLRQLGVEELPPAPAQ